MPSREQRRHGTDPSLEKWLHVEDKDGTPFDIFLRDISGKDEWDYLQMMASTGMTNPPGLCDIFLEGKVTLTNIAGLIWSQRRKHERKLTVMDVLKTVNMTTIETMELHDPAEEEDALESLPQDDPQRQLAEIAKRKAEDAEGFGDGSGVTAPVSGPSTE